jgi:hypothetical protein
VISFSSVWRFTQKQTQGFSSLPFGFGHGLEKDDRAFNRSVPARAIDFPAPRLEKAAAISGDYGKIDVLEHGTYYPQSRLKDSRGRQSS